MVAPAETNTETTPSVASAAAAASCKAANSFASQKQDKPKAESKIGSLKKVSNANKAANAFASQKK